MYIIVKGITTVKGTETANRRNEKLTFKKKKKNALFRLCISKINNILIDNAEDLDIVMPMYNLLEYSENYSMKPGSLRNFYRDDINDGTNENNDADNYI